MLAEWAYDRIYATAANAPTLSPLAHPREEHAEALNEIYARRHG